VKQRISWFGKSFLAAGVLALCLSVGVSRTWSAESENSLRAGIAKVDITPDKPVRMSGYSGRKGLSTGVHDRLYARVVAFQSGTKRLVLVSTDLIGFYRTYEPIRDAICDRFNLKPSEIFLSSTHTHSGPTPTLSEDRHPNNLEYTRNLRAKLLEAVGQAIEKTGPVEMGVGRGYSPVGANRREVQPDGSIRLGRNPYGPTDKEVLVMKLAKPDGTPIAALFDYATHATSLGSRNLRISSDVLGIAAQFVEKILGPDVTAPVFAGASGNIDPWFRVLPSFETENGWIPEPELLGTLLGEEVVHVFRKVEPSSKSAEIRTEFATLELPAKRRKGRDADDASPTRELNVTVARIGDVGFVGVGCELLTEVGMTIKAGSPYEQTFMITHCNGGAGYLPPEHLYPEGGYEVDRTGFAPQAADILVKESLRMLAGLK
jgi:neutral ceramidase